MPTCRGNLYFFEAGSVHDDASNPVKNKLRLQDTVHNQKLLFSSLDEEMEAGRSKLAKLRERIRRAKGAIKEADEALQKKS